MKPGNLDQGKGNALIPAFVNIGHCVAHIEWLLFWKPGGGSDGRNQSLQIDQKAAAQAIKRKAPAMLMIAKASEVA